MINVGPTKEGIIPFMFEHRLLQLGEWLKINGEAIYDTSPWLYQNDTSNSDVWYTSKKKWNETANTTETFTEVFAFFLKWPNDNVLQMGSLIHFVKNSSYDIQLFGPEGPFSLYVRTFGYFDVIARTK